MAATTRRQVEDAIIALLAPLKPALVKAVKPFQGDINDLLDDPKRVTEGQYPALLVTTDDGIYHHVSVQRRRSVIALAVEIYVIASSLRSREEVARDDVAGGGVGAYKLMELVREAIHGVELVTIPGAGRPEVVAEKKVVQLPDLQVWRCTFSVPVDVAMVSSAPAITEIDVRGSVPLADSTFGAGLGSAMEGSALAVVGGVVTFTDAGNAFAPGWVGAIIDIAGATSAANNGSFTITAVPSGTEIQFMNPDAVAEDFLGSWTVKAAPVTQTAAT